ncbi:MAG TPA: PHP domain-containing protein [Kineosporiaceae bacterium]
MPADGDAGAVVAYALPPDGHVHSEWSWDALAGSMHRTCARAVELGLPAIAFTEHADFTPWTIDVTDQAAQEFPPQWARWYADGIFTPPPLDLQGYRTCLEACRDAFPRLRILSGVELSEPHWHPDRTRQFLAEGGFDRILASLHGRPDGSVIRPIDGDTYQRHTPTQFMHWYLAEVDRMAEEFDGFEVLAHIDYPVRFWPGGPESFDPEPLEAPFRAALSALAHAGRLLEINTRTPLTPTLLRWWHQEGGAAVTFGSDAHDPDSLAHNFREAAAMAEAQGFRPGRRPHDPWPRSSPPTTAPGTRGVGLLK